ncbi:hypothetical protein [Promicromonospora kroppenstedtii]|uniref:hypothetical protein n=1 Tax=Promicromonospora kroppenstedtii TaxID=440482 RepID=UPI0004AD5869|nr:hypothetical protein [Promicromonospora kroppenstedtii]
MDKKLTTETLAMVLFFVACLVISLGATQGLAAVWWIGFAAFVVAGLLPVWTRYMDHTKDAPRDAGMEFDDRVS